MSNLSQNKIYRKVLIINSKKSPKENLPIFSDILSIPSNPEDIFTLISPIGHGAFGSVYKAIHKETKKVYAIKIIQYFKDEPNILSNIKHMENINFCYKTVQEETSLMRLVNSSDYIVKYYGSYFSRKSNTLWLILEFCESGSVIDLMLAMDRTYTEIEIATIIKMVLQGLIVIHSKNLIHRDVKGANILLTGNGFAKIGDFGVGVQLQEDFRKSKKGSPYWMSPQVVNNENYSIGTDIWSLGITCLELFNGEPPNSALKPGEVMEKIGKCIIDFNELFKNKNMSNTFKNFVRRCLVIEENKRAKAEELINDEFIVKYSKDNKLLEELYHKHIKDLDDYRKEVEEYELEIKMKQKKEYENQMLIQQQKEKQNMSIECSYSQVLQDEVKNDDNNNICKDNNDEEEILFNKSINSLFFKDSTEKNNDSEMKKKCKDCIKTESNNSIKYFDINDTEEYNSPNIIISKDNNIFDNDDQMLFKEKYNKIYSNDITDKKKENNLSSDIVNLSSNINKKSNINDKSINIKEYMMNSNISNKSNDKIKNNNPKNSGKNKKMKCCIINCGKQGKSRQNNNNNFDENDIFSKTMENPNLYSYEINEDLRLSNTAINKHNRKSMNLINNIKSLSILSNNKVLRNKKIKNSIEQYRPTKTEDNICKKKIFSFTNIITKPFKTNQLKNPSIKSGKLNLTTENSNTNDNSNSNPNLSFNANNNNNSKSSNIINSINSVYTKKKYSQNLILVNKDNNIFTNCNNYNNKLNNMNNNKIPLTKKSIKSSGENNANISEKMKFIDSHNKIQKDILSIEIQNVLSNSNNKEDINDSDDDGIINQAKNFGGKSSIYEKENKENININTKIDNYALNDNGNITGRSNHSYSVIESIEVIPSMNKNSIFSFAHKKYFS